MAGSEADGKSRSAKELDYFEGMVIMNDFFDYAMPELKPAELKLALFILRKTIGWRKYSEEIGTTELCKGTGLDKDTVKRTIHTLCEKLGIKTKQSRREGVLSRRQYRWEINARVTATLNKARDQHGVGGKIPPTPRGQNTLHGGGQNPPTQYNPSQLSPKKGRAEEAAGLTSVDFLKLDFYRSPESTDQGTPEGVNFGDLGFYGPQED